MCEAEACLAYALYLKGDYENCIVHSKLAIKEYKKFGKLDSLKTARETLLGAYEKTGNHQKSLEVLKLLENDPLGEEEA